MSSSLPSGSTLSGSDQYFVISPFGREVDRNTLPNATTFIHLDAIGYVIDTGPQADTGAPPYLAAPIAQVCSVALCASVYDLEYNGTAFVERRLKQIRGNWLDVDGILSFLPTEADAGVTDLIVPSLTITNTSISNLTEMFCSYLSGSLWDNKYLEWPFQEARAEPAWKLLYSAFHLYQTSDFARNELDNSGPLLVFNDFETSLTVLLRTVMNEIRRLYGTLIPLGKGDADVDLTQPFYRIRWAWVAFPVALEVISTVYFLGIVMATKRARLPLWKNSSLAVMYHGIEPTQYEAGMAAERISEMDAVAKRTKVRLAYTKLGYRLVGMEEEV